MLVTSGSAGDPHALQVATGPFDGTLTYWSSGRLEATLTLPLGPFGPDPSGALIWDFEDGTLQGWTAVHNDATNGMGIGTVANDWAAGGGDYAIEPRNFDLRDDPHDPIVIRSPSFYLDPSQDIVVRMLGGRAAGVNGSGFYLADVDGLATSTSAASGQKKMSFAVRRVSDGAYLKFGQRQGEPSDTVWEDITIAGVTLAGLAFEEFTIDIYDALSAPWGWITIDSVRVGGRLISSPGPGAAVRRHRQRIDPGIADHRAALARAPVAVGRHREQQQQVGEGHTDDQRRVDHQSSRPSRINASAAISSAQSTNSTAGNSGRPKTVSSRSHSASSGKLNSASAAQNRASSRCGRRPSSMLVTSSSGSARAGPCAGDFGPAG